MQKRPPMLGEVGHDQHGDSAAGRSALVDDQHGAHLGGVGPDHLRGKRVEPAQVDDPCTEPVVRGKAACRLEAQPESVGVADEEEVRVGIGVAVEADRAGQQMGGGEYAVSQPSSPSAWRSRS